jgi:hypothetical protein
MNEDAPDLDGTPIRRADVLARETPDGAVLVDVVSGGCWELNRVGAALWSLLDANTTLRAACEILRRRYDVAAEVIERDVLAVAAQLSSAGLVSIRKPSPPARAE